MFTADEARALQTDDLDERLKYSVTERSEGKSAYIRVYNTDPYLHTIEAELLKRGFININVPDICLSGDVYFEWE